MKEFAYSGYFEVYPPPPRSIGIIDLAGKCDLIYGAQQLAGKILRAKDLRPVHPHGNLPPPP